jgi:hypothetical protein
VFRDTAEKEPSLLNAADCHVFDEKQAPPTISG